MTQRVRDPHLPPVHVVHFDGHGVYRPDTGLGYLLFENGEHQAQLVNAADLGAKPSDIEALIDQNLWWKDGEAGWSINGWADKQQTSAESEARSNRMRAAANARWHPKPKAV